MMSDYIERLEQERDALRAKLKIAREALEEIERNEHRAQNLYPHLPSNSEIAKQALAQLDHAAP